MPCEPCPASKLSGRNVGRARFRFGMGISKMGNLGSWDVIHRWPYDDDDDGVSLCESRLPLEGVRGEKRGRRDLDSGGIEL